jgi:hypothetical protein
MQPVEHIAEEEIAIMASKCEPKLSIETPLRFCKRKKKKFKVRP